MHKPASLALAWVLTALTVAIPTSHGLQSPLGEAFLRSSVREIAAIVEREYFDPQLAEAAASTIRSKLSDGAYAGESLRALADAVSRDLFVVTRDKHLVVAVVPQARQSPAHSEEQERQSRGRRENFGVRRVEILPGNVGYLDLRYFYRPEEASVAIRAAMSLLLQADALILDMRSNGGGSPDTIALLASYLFEDAELPLFSIIPRQKSDARQYTTGTTSPPERNGTRPVYVLTSKGTFSGGEGLPFLLQERKRAVVIGERTAGAANPGRPYPVNDRLTVTVPNGQVKTAITEANWEGTGVEPDVAAPAADALRIAHSRALEQLLRTFQSGPWHDALKRHLATLQDGR